MPGRASQHTIAITTPTALLNLWMHAVCVCLCAYIYIYIQWQRDKIERRFYSLKPIFLYKKREEGWLQVFTEQSLSVAKPISWNSQSQSPTQKCRSFIFPPFKPNRSSSLENTPFHPLSIKHPAAQMPGCRFAFFPIVLH